MCEFDFTVALALQIEYALRAVRVRLCCAPAEQSLVVVVVIELLKNCSSALTTAEGAEWRRR